MDNNEYKKMILVELQKIVKHQVKLESEDLTIIGSESIIESIKVLELVTVVEEKLNLQFKVQHNLIEELFKADLLPVYKLNTFTLFLKKLYES